jgi:hypothetical protein
MGGHAFISAGIEGFAPDNTPKVHKRFEISGNTFKNISNHAIHVAGIEELVVKDNTFDTDRDDLFVVDGKAVEF